jgi:hypothetical protein
MKIHTIAFILLVIGGINWLLVGIVSGWDLANYVGASVARVVYILVGISAIYEVAMHKQFCRNCKP